VDLLLRVRRSIPSRPARSSVSRRPARSNADTCLPQTRIYFQLSNPAAILSPHVILPSIPSSVNIEGPLKPPPDKQLILDSIIAIARESGRAPSRSKFLSRSGFSEHYVLQFFPTWNDAVRAAGLFPHTMNRRLEDRELFEDWAFVVRTKGKIPSRRVYPHFGQYDPSTFQRFGPWSKLPEAFRNFAQGKPEWADVVALLPAPASKPAPNPTRPEPVGARRVVPAVATARKNSSGPGPVGARFSASHAPKPSPKREPKPARPEPVGAGLAPPALRAPDRKSASSPPTSHVRHAPLKGRPTYGGALDFRGLRHEPVNEQGVVLLFALVAKELGYIVESVQSGFPDCEAKRQIGPQQWQRVHIEFEFESRNFRTHGHPHNGCDVIVCWRHNWPDCPPQIEILELSSLIKSLPTSDD